MFSAVFRLPDDFTAYLLRLSFQFEDFLFKAGNDWQEIVYFFGVISLFVLSEQKEVGDVLRPPAIEVHFVLLNNRLS